jgi:hypothetical protein
MQGRIPQCFETKLVQARGRINAGGLGWILLRRVDVGHGPFC